MRNACSSTVTADKLSDAVDGANCHRSRFAWLPRMLLLGDLLRRNDKENAADEHDRRMGATEEYR